MNVEERITQLETELAKEREENAIMRAENAHLGLKIEQVLARLTEEEEHLEEDSNNSSKSLSSDELTHQLHRQRKPSCKKIGGQLGHAGHSLQMVKQLDTIVTHRLMECTHCHLQLEGIMGQVIEQRQAQDLPVW